MNAKTLSTLIVSAASFAALAVAVPAYASEASLTQPASSVLTRDAVREAGIAARFGHSHLRGDATSFGEPVGFEKTRAQVHAETLQAIRVGALNRHEKHSFPTAAQLDSIEGAGQLAVQVKMAAAQ